MPLSNARYALNAANARWGSLYDALYGTDAIPEDGGATRGSGYNKVRGVRVIARAREILDTSARCCRAATSMRPPTRSKTGNLSSSLAARASPWRGSGQFVGFLGEPAHLPQFFCATTACTWRSGSIARARIARDDPAGIADVILEAAITTIMDLEDSVAAVDADDKVEIYRNWLELTKGTLTASFDKAGRMIDRRLNRDRTYKKPAGGELTLPGRSLMLIRNVGHHMYTDAVRIDAQDVPEGIVDAAVTTLIAVHDLRALHPLRNSRTGSIYIVSRRCTGSAEVAFTDELFARVEDLLLVPRNTLKIGIMDEEAPHHPQPEGRDPCRWRTGWFSSIPVSSTAPAMKSTRRLKPARWCARRPCAISRGLRRTRTGTWISGSPVGCAARRRSARECGRCADRMADMLTQKIAHPEAGANTAWVPSPTAATLHALHYHQVDVAERQAELAGKRRARLSDLLTIPISQSNWAPHAIQEELDNNCQGILGYVVRWIDQGVGCSKVPDIHDVGLMEDRATLRISSQHVANWLLHGVVDDKQVMATLRRMAKIVRTARTPGGSEYRPMAPDYDGPAFRAARDLIFLGRSQPNGYTEWILHARRREAKALQASHKHQWRQKQYSEMAHVASAKKMQVAAGVSDLRKPRRRASCIR